MGESTMKRFRRVRRAGVFLFSLFVVVIAGYTTTRWLDYITESQRAAAHDRARLHAFYAAEAGIEEVVDYFNHPGNYRGRVPDEYVDELATTPYPGVYPGAPMEYALFEPYILEVQKDSRGQIMYDGNGDPIVLKSTWLRNLGNGYSSKFPTCRLDIEGNENLVFRDAEGHERARVVSLLLVHPLDLETYGDPVPPRNDRVLTKVISTARTPEGVEVTVEAMLRENPLSKVVSPAAIVSSATARFKGQFNVHWGEVWAKSDIDLFSGWNNKGTGSVPRASEDPWVFVRTNNRLRDAQGREHADGREGDGYAPNAILPDAPNYKIPYLDSVLARDGKGESKFADYENLVQHENLEFPEYDYWDVKLFFLIYGLPYYFTDTSGKIWGHDEATGELTAKSYHDWFHADATNLEDYWNPMKQFAFIDSVPVDDQGNMAHDSAGRPIVNHIYYPRDPAQGGVMATIANTGGSTHTRGMQFIVNNMTYGGGTGGSIPPARDIRALDGDDYVLSPPSSQGFQDLPEGNPRITHNGLIYSWGEIGINGSKTFYGSLYTRTGFSGTGSREVWYNFRFKDGKYIDINASRVVRTAWTRRTAPIPPI